MYLKSLHLKNLKRVRDLELSFVDAGGKPRPVTVLIGPNGTAKTSILQAIALCAVGSIQANVLADKSIGVLRDRRVAEPMRLTARFETLNDVALTSHIVHDDMRPHELYGDFENEVDPNNVFVAGYGVARSIPGVGENMQLDRPSLDRLRNLFSPLSRPTSLRFADYLDNTKRFAQLLNSAIKSAGLIPGLRKVELRGQGGVRNAGDLIERERFCMESEADDIKLPALAMSHGYQAMVSWVADLIGQAMLDKPSLASLKDIRGIVLIDELDAFLHPAWQRGLVGGMQRAFPNVQFIVSTHSPILISEVPADAVVRLQLSSEHGNVERLVHDEHTGELRAASGPDDAGGAPDPRLLTASALLRDWFGMEDTSKGVGLLGRSLYEYRALEASGKVSSKSAKGLKSQLKSAGLI